MLPKVTIIVTCYNYARYVECALRSVAAQTYEDIECVVIDDCSTDDSYKIICSIVDERKDHKFRTIRLGQNSGQMKAFRAGLENSSGRFVVFLDADDALDPLFVEKHIAVHLNSAQGAAMTASNTRTVDDAGQVLEGTFYAFGRLMPGDASFVDIPYTALLRTPLFFPTAAFNVRYRQPARRGWPWSATSSFMFRRDILSMIVSEQTDAIRICADYYLVQLSCAIGGALLIYDVLGDYRIHKSNNFIGSVATGARRRPRFAQSAALMRSIDDQADQFVAKNRDALAAILPDEFFPNFIVPSSAKRKLVTIWDNLPAWFQKLIMPLADFIDARVK